MGLRLKELVGQVIASPLWRSWAILPEKLAHHFKEEIRTILFSAAVVAILHKLDLLYVFLKLSLLCVVSLAGQIVLPPTIYAQTEGGGSGGISVVVLDEQDWSVRYEGRSPLNRCLLMEDLAGLMPKKPGRLVVDFDLSPDVAPEINSDTRGRDCQLALDLWLDEHAKDLVLLAPLRVPAGSPMLAPKLVWMKQRCENKQGFAFGDGRHDVAFGVALDYAPKDVNALSAVAGHSETGTICKDILSEQSTSEKKFETWLVEENLAPEQHDEAEASDHERKLEPIDFVRSYAATLPRTLSQQVSQPTSPSVVFFGGIYGSGSADKFITPFGMMSGVSLHASKYLSLSSNKKVSNAAHWADMLIDIAMGFLFSIPIAIFWGRFAKVQSEHHVLRRERGTFVVLLFIAVYAFMVYFSFVIAVDLFVTGIVIAPLILALAMLVDGFVSGPIAAFSHDKKAAHHSHADEDARCISLQLLPLLVVGLIAKKLHYEPSAVIALVSGALALLADRWRFLAIAVTPKHKPVPWESLLWLGASFVLMAVNRSKQWVVFANWLTEFGIWLCMYIILLLLVGLVTDLARYGAFELKKPAFSRPSMPERTSKFSQALDWLSLFSYLARGWIFWSVVSYAVLVLLLDH